VFFVASLSLGGGVWYIQIFVFGGGKTERGKLYPLLTAVTSSKRRKTSHKRKKTVDKHVQGKPESNHYRSHQERSLLGVRRERGFMEVFTELVTYYGDGGMVLKEELKAQVSFCIVCKIEYGNITK